MLYNKSIVSCKASLQKLQSALLGLTANRSNGILAHG